MNASRVCRRSFLVQPWKLGICLLLISPAVPVFAAQHPLDALDASEIAACVSLLRAGGQLDDKTLIHSLTLEEPSKQKVLEWKMGDAVPRSARVVARRAGETSELVVSLTDGKLVSVKKIKEGQPMLTVPELFGAAEVALSDDRVREALTKRGITDFEKVFGAARTIGSFSTEKWKGRRLVKVDFFDISKNASNVFGTPIEGLYVTVDIDEGKVLEVADTGVVPIPPAAPPLSADAQENLRNRKAVKISSPEGRNFTMNGSVISWEKWRFHIRWDVRAGLILSLVTYNDQGKTRSLLYQGYLAEIFVPYQDPTEGWYYRNYMDEGEYGLGTMGSPLVAGADCPENALFVSPVMANPAGGADTLQNRVCVFERATGEPTWRHFDLVSEALDSRPDVELIVRSIAAVGNYDYVFDWVLDAKGRLTFRSGATGIDAVKGVRSRHASDAKADEETAWGPLVAPGLSGVYHSHFFSLRLDVDIDGPRNRFLNGAVVAETQPKDSPRSSVWRLRPQVAKTESEAKFQLSYEHPSFWHVENISQKNALGYPTSYMLMPGMNARPLADEKDPPLSRAMFANHHLWVTPYAPQERYAAGDYPNQSSPGQGLPEWTKEGRNLDGVDLVLWYTMGFHHAPSAEDWPVYNLGWHTVTLTPYNFFDQNPAMDLPCLECRSKQ